MANLVRPWQKPGSIMINSNSCDSVRFILNEWHRSIQACCKLGIRLMLQRQIRGQYLARENLRILNCQHSEVVWEDNRRQSRNWPKKTANWALANYYGKRHNEGRSHCAQVDRLGWMECGLRSTSTDSRRFHPNQYSQRSCYSRCRNSFLRCTAPSFASTCPCSSTISSMKCPKIWLK